MRRDFTPPVYRELCGSLLDNNFQIFPLKDYFKSKKTNKKVAFLRHDVDARPSSSLEIAIIENELGISSTYYFRTIESVLKADLIAEIYSLGHEIGYHYEVLAQANGNKKFAIEQFDINLSKLREIVPIKTICMHGSPWSKWKDSDLWDDYNISDFGIELEAFLTPDFDKMVYYTDTGRRWDGDSYNVRDRVESSLEKSPASSTFDLIKIISKVEQDIMITTHPQRWNGDYGSWLYELFAQNTKNVAKLLSLKLRKNK